MKNQYVQIIIFIVLSIMIAILAFKGIKYYEKQISYNQVVSGLNAIQNKAYQYLDEKQSYRYFKPCTMPDNFYKTVLIKKNDTLLADDYLGISSDYNDCSFAINTSNLDNDKIRVIMYPSSDYKSLNIKLAWADKNRNGVSDISEEKNRDIRKELEDFLRSHIRNSL